MKTFTQYLETQMDTQEKQPCQVCKGEGRVTIETKDRAGRNPYASEPIRGIISCPVCNGKGYLTPEDRKRVISIEMLNQIVS